jgi:asparagine synthase (glutamine-hydrolysing)
MCGIAGIAGFQDEELVREMTCRLTHRGPDEEGFYWGGEVSFGHRRLSIIDLEGGKQPMKNADGSLVVSFNGQIYNFKQIKKDLGEDYPFRTECDTEVLLALYAKYGPEMVHPLRGMFAFALWDARERKLFLARDRIGIKPLYYAQLGNRLLFASEPKALLAFPDLSREIDPTALDAYLSLLYVPPPYSIFRSIRQLPPGHTLTWKTGEVRIERYWDAQPDPDDRRSEEEWAEELAPILEESIRMRMMSDVPLGAFLSGGIDSSTIVSTLAQSSGRPVETFCIGFGKEGSAYEERPAAREVAQYFGTNHHEMEVSLDLVGSLEAMVRGFDEPFGNPTALLTYELSKFTREYVTVALSGDGGDEVFGGYPRYQGLLWSETLEGVPRFLRKPVQAALGAQESSTARNWRRWGRQLLEGCGLPADLRYESWVAYSSGADNDRLLSPDLAAEVRKAGRIHPVREFFNRSEQGDSAARAFYADLHGFLPENVLRYADRMSMAHGLEIRVPFTDHILVEEAMRVPSAYRVRRLASKRLLRKMMQGRLPEKVLERKKLGFNPPMGVWLQREGSALIETWLDPSRIQSEGVFQSEEIGRLIREHTSRKREWGLRLWSLIVFQAWRQIYSGES